MILNKNNQKVSSELLFLQKIPSVVKNSINVFTNNRTKCKLITEKDRKPSNQVVPQQCSLDVSASRCSINKLS